MSPKILKTEPIEWKKLQFLQANDFKELSRPAMDRLKKSILENQFIQPFYIWEKESVQFGLDGRHRVLALEELIADGQQVPELLPGTFINCKNKAEAAKYVLIYSSVYAKILQDGLINFSLLYELNIDALKEQINFPHLTEFAAPELEIPAELIRSAVNKPASMKITFASVPDLESAKAEIETILTKYPKAFLSVSAGEI